jgi:hypothetical protein
MAKKERLDRATEEAKLDRYPIKGTAIGALTGGLAFGGLGAYRFPRPFRGYGAAVGGATGAVVGAGTGFNLARDAQRLRVKRAIDAEKNQAKRAIEAEKNQAKEASMARSALRGAGYGALGGTLMGAHHALTDTMSARRRGVSSKEDTKNRLKHIAVAAGLGALGGGIVGATHHHFTAGRGSGGGHAGYRPPPSGSYKDHASTIGFDPSSVKTKKQAQDAYRKAARTYHPDINPGAGDKMKEVNNAWDNIKNTSWYQGLKEASYLPFLTFLRAVYAGQ